ncbi:uncharacterized protein LOC123012425 isoform X4 [Tribolium madens]|uniref:uncharacterized protein LOC123012425 isoform X4 n=1 Tax=Tribolium madens TaxID=41895 RepID=UPI001CF731D7|nr:uncharacterized protein LOC123012425 isoform X4 [Tribolium madens]XP_044266265.1 uncharacterized protein LOC123012425 isoform X4 [Tribolium madens]
MDNYGLHFSTWFSIVWMCRRMSISRSLPVSVSEGANSCKDQQTIFQTLEGPSSLIAVLYQKGILG